MASDTAIDQPIAKDPISDVRAQGRSLLRLGFFFSVFTNLLMLTGPLFMLQVYDRVLASRSEETLVALLGLVVMLYAFYAVLEYSRGRVVARVGARYQKQLGPQVFRHAVAARAKGRTPEATNQDVDAVRAFYGSPLPLALFDLPWTPVFFGAIFIFHPMLGWLALAGGATIIGLAVVNQLFTFRKVAAVHNLAGSVHMLAAQAEAAGPYVIAQGMSASLEARWRTMQESALGRLLAANDVTGSFASLTRALRLFLQSAVLALGAWLVLHNELTAGAMIAASILMGRALAPVEQGLPQWPVAQRARQGWRNIRALFSQGAADEVTTRLPDPVAALNARALSLVGDFGDKPILQNLSFYVAPGEALGIIGKSGSGKSTLARVLLGLTDASAGEVRLGGAVIGQYGAERIGSLIGYLPQDIQFFEGTLGENIARMETNPDPDLVVAAAKKARVHDVILNLRDGYDTRIGPNDIQLSGGQKQRLALARALYGDPIVLILDEPNSALDTDGSDALNQVIADMKAEQKSVVIMTHRPAAIAECDQLLVLEDGRAGGYGPRDEILRSMIKNSDTIQHSIKRGAVHA